jgi:hypothetical protein
LIEKLGTLPMSPTLTAAMALINPTSNSDTKDRNAVICDLINKLQAPAPSIIEKQQLITQLISELDAEIQLDTQLLAINAKLLCPSILLVEEEYPTIKNDAFYNVLKTFINGTTAEDGTKVNGLKDTLLAAPETQIASIKGTLEAKQALINELLNTLNSTDLDKFNEALALLCTKISDNEILTTKYTTELINASTSGRRKDLILGLEKHMLFTDFLIREGQKELVAAWTDNDGNWMDSAGNYFKKYNDEDGRWYGYNEYTANDKLADASWVNKTGEWQTGNGELVVVDVKRTADGIWRYASIDNNDENQIIIDAWWPSSVDTTDKIIKETTDLLDRLLDDVEKLGKVIIPEAFKDAYKILKLEEQLLDEIRATDKEGYFYYNVPIEDNVAIDFIESDDTLNTLMNPLVNYDINNVNNSFVISKLDINYLTKGLQIARSSRIN